MVNMLAPVFQPQIALDCLQIGRPMISVSYRDENVRRFHREAQRKGLLILTELGLDPGIDHMTAMTEVIRECHGVVDKFVGDEIMAVFGALKSYGNDAANAARASLLMMQERQRRNASMKLPFELGIGIASGQVVAGCMGSMDRLNYTVLGARVNLAARLCRAAGPGEILLDEGTLNQFAGDSFQTQPLPPTKIKGFREPVEVFALFEPPK